MKSFLTAAIGAAILSFGGPLYGDTPTGEPVISEAETYEWQAPARQWNRWVCNAYARGTYRAFRGFSYFFEAGSGEGQQARSIAHLSALRQCQFTTGRQCFSRVESNCQVQRFNR